MEDLLVHSTECPFCGRTFKRIEEVIQKEKEIWRPLDCDLPKINLPSVWIEAETESTDSITTTDGRGTWTFTND